MTDPLISVLMGTFNDEDYLEKSIESVLSQTYENFEFIVVNDGSTDQTGKILGRYQKIDSRLDILTHKRNQGLTVSLNRAIEECTGKYVARMDADDWCRKDRFEKQSRFLEENPDCGMVGSFNYIYRQESKTKELSPKPKDYETILKKLPWENPFCHGSVMIRRNVLEELNGYDERYRYSQDYELWSRLVPKYRARNLDVPLVTRRHHEGAVTAQLSNLLHRFSCDFGARYSALQSERYGFCDYGSLIHPFVNALKSIYHAIL